MHERVDRLLDARPVTKPTGWRWLMRGIVRNARASVTCSGSSGSRFRIALRGRISSFRRNAVEFMARVRHIRHAAWVGDAG